VEPASSKAPLPLAAGERLDVAFTAPEGVWSLHSHDGNSAAAGLRVPILAPEAALPTVLPDTDWESTQPPLDLAAYSSTAAPSPQRATRNFTLRLNEREKKLSQQSGGHEGMCLCANVH